MMAQPRRILLADDDLSMRAGVAELLSSLGLEVFLADDGLEAVDIARDTLVHAALVDFQMPRCTGLEALPLLHSVREGLPVILYSGALSPATTNMMLEVGAFSVLEKPVKPDRLRQEVLRALDQSPLLN